MCQSYTDLTSPNKEAVSVLCSSQVQEGSRGVRLGTLIALMVSEGEDWKQVEIPALEPVAPTVAPPTAAPPTAADPAPQPTTAPSALKQSVYKTGCFLSKSVSKCYYIQSISSGHKSIILMVTVQDKFRIYQACLKKTEKYVVNIYKVCKLGLNEGL